MGSNRMKEERVGSGAKGHNAETFDGNGFWEEFIFQFHWRSKANQWTEMEKAGHLVESLRGQALSLICVLADSVSTCDDMVAALEKRYTCKGQEQDFMCRLRTRHQKPTESLKRFAVDLEILVRRALPGVSNEVIETVALQQFYDGIRDERIREEVVASSSTSLCEALSVALQVEARLIRVNMFQKMLNRRQGTTFGGNQRRIRFSKWRCFKCGEKGHLRGKCPSTDDMPRKTDSNCRTKCTFRSVSLPEAVTEGLEYGVIARSSAPSAPDSVGLSSLEDNNFDRIENSGEESCNEITKYEGNEVTIRQMQS